MDEKGVSHIAYFRTDGGSTKLYTQEYVDEKDKEIERLNNIINKSLRKLRASKKHFKTERENNAVTFTIRILERRDKE